MHFIKGTEGKKNIVSSQKWMICGLHFPWYTDCYWQKGECVIESP
jgi:hypothetical protein